MRNLKHTKISNYWLSAPIVTSNKYEDLEMEEGAEENNQQKENPAKQQKPPPIFVDGVSNISPLTQLLSEITKNEHEIKILKLLKNTQ
jgi:hypothetical protein